MNKAVVDYFFVELNLGAHFEALRHFLLMEDGEFAQSLSDLLFEKVSLGGPGARVAAGRLWISDPGACNPNGTVQLLSTPASGRALWSKCHHFCLYLGSSHCLARGRDCCHSVPALPPELQEAKEGLLWWSGSLYSAFPMRGLRADPWSEN